MQHPEVSGAVRHIYIYIYVIRRLKVNRLVLLKRRQCLLCEIVTEFSTLSRLNVRNSTFLKTVCVLYGS